MSEQNEDLSRAELRAVRGLEPELNEGIPIPSRPMTPEEESEDRQLEQDHARELATEGGDSPCAQTSASAPIRTTEAKSVPCTEARQGASNAAPNVPSVGRAASCPICGEVSELGECCEDAPSQAVESETATPRTDAATQPFYQWHAACHDTAPLELTLASIARTLEKELTEVTQQRDAALLQIEAMPGLDKLTVDSMWNARTERDALRAELEEAKHYLKQKNCTICGGQVFVPSESVRLENETIKKAYDAVQQQLTEAKRERDEEKKRDFAWKNTQEIDLVRVKERADHDRVLADLAASHSQYQELVKEKLDLEEELVVAEGLIAQLNKEREMWDAQEERSRSNLAKASNDFAKAKDWNALCELQLKNLQSLVEDQEADLAQARELIVEMQKQDKELCSKFEAQADHLIKADSDLSSSHAREAALRVALEHVLEVSKNPERYGRFLFEEDLRIVRTALSLPPPPVVSRDVSAHDERDETRRWLLAIGMEIGVPVQIEGDQLGEPHAAWKGLSERIIAKLKLGASRDVLVQARDALRFTIAYAQASGHTLKSHVKDALTAANAEIERRTK